MSVAVGVQIGGVAKTMAAKVFRVGRSSTGLGLFAVRPIAKKQYIATYSGRWITNAEAARRENRGSKYMFEVNSRWTIDGSSRRNLGRYVNHSCRPNSEAVLRKGKMIFVALRGIAPDEEITFDYGKEYFDLFIRPIGCRCAACTRKAALKRARRRKATARPGPARDAPGEANRHRTRCRRGPSFPGWRRRGGRPAAG